ncbi:hypothetical protein D3C73_1521560 [compost metagenome]
MNFRPCGLWIHCIYCRHEQDIYSFTLCKRSIPLLIPWIAVKVFIRPELNRIHKYADNYNIRLLFGGPHQARMPLMQVAHSRDEAYAALLHCSVGTAKFA